MATFKDTRDYFLELILNSNGTFKILAKSNESEFELIDDSIYLEEILKFATFAKGISTSKTFRRILCDDGKERFYASAQKKDSYKSAKKNDLDNAIKVKDLEIGETFKRPKSEHTYTYIGKFYTSENIDYHIAIYAGMNILRFSSISISEITGFNPEFSDIDRNLNVFENSILTNSGIGRDHINFLIGNYGKYSSLEDECKTPFDLKKYSSLYNQTLAVKILKFDNFMDQNISYKFEYIIYDYETGLIKYKQSRNFNTYVLIHGKVDENYLFNFLNYGIYQNKKFLESIQDESDLGFTDIEEEKLDNLYLLKSMSTAMIALRR